MSNDREQTKTKFKGPGEWRTQARRLEGQEAAPKADAEEDSEE